MAGIVEHWVPLIISEQLGIELKAVITSTVGVHCEFVNHDDIPDLMTVIMIASNVFI